jgi:hypothetical protein
LFGLEEICVIMIMLLFLMRFKSLNKFFVFLFFDKEILDALKNKEDRRVEFIWESIKELKESFIQKNLI